jgi:coenzyme F420-0:L-glutamate ligase/coenzyme F420-1:gamma-L-glutamate ligase
MNLHAIPDIPLVSPGDDLASVIIGCMEKADVGVVSGDIIVIAQKIVSKAEDRYVDLSTISPSSQARQLAEKVDKDPRLVHLILSESDQVVGHRPGVLIVAHRLGYVMANAGIDVSNLGPGSNVGEQVLLLPKDSNASSARLRSALESHFHKTVGVIISDSIGRAWRNGSIGTALGSAGVPALWDRIGEQDLFGRVLQVTQVGYADQVAAAAALMMGEGAEGLPVVKVTGLDWKPVTVDANMLLRPKDQDLFR